jgi:hypothetical protein
VENAFYEGPLRLRLPVAMQLDPDGAFSFEAPLPSPEGSLGMVRARGWVAPLQRRDTPQGSSSLSAHGIGCCGRYLNTSSSSPLQFVDGFKSLVIPSHLRPPAQAINWVPLTGDAAVDAAMQVGENVVTVAAVTVVLSYAELSLTVLLCWRPPLPPSYRARHCSASCWTRCRQFVGCWQSWGSA